MCTYMQLPVVFGACSIIDCVCIALKRFWLSLSSHQTGVVHKMPWGYMCAITTC